MEKLSKKTKHDHTLTSILKFAIFTVIMLAPIFSVASRCLYVICNKNAKDSYSQSVAYKYQTNEVNTYEDLKRGHIYHISIDFAPSASQYTFRTTAIYNFTQNNFYITNSESEEHTYLIQINTTYCAIRDENYSSLLNYNFTSPFTKFEFDIVYYNQIATGTFDYLTISSSDFNILTSGTKNAYLDNAFEYSLSQIEESSYYNWATNLGIYTPIYNMVHGLGGHDIIALLLAYWSIYTAIYIVFDIVIACFVKITHLLQSE